MKIVLFTVGLFLLLVMISFAVAVGVAVGMETFFNKKGVKNGNSEKATTKES